MVLLYNFASDGNSLISFNLLSTWLFLAIIKNRNFGSSEELNPGEYTVLCPLKAPGYFSLLFLREIKPRHN